METSVNDGNFIKSKVDTGEREDTVGDIANISIAGIEPGGVRFLF